MNFTPGLSIFPTPALDLNPGKSRLDGTDVPMAEPANIPDGYFGTKRRGKFLINHFVNNSTEGQVIKDGTATLMRPPICGLIHVC